MQLQYKVFEYYFLLIKLNKNMLKDKLSAQIEIHINMNNNSNHAITHNYYKIELSSKLLLITMPKNYY